MTPDEADSAETPDPRVADLRTKVRLLLIGNTILLLWVAVLSFAVIELVRHGGPAAEIRRLDQRIDDVTSCLWELEAEVGKSAPTNRNGDGIAGTGPNRPECPPLAVAPGPR